MFAVAVTLAIVLITVPAGAGLISHYTFDSDDSGTTADSVGSAFATLGPKVGIDTGVSKVGGGSLVMTRWGAGDVGYGGDGAVTSNSFAWTDDARTLTFWWQCKSGTIDNVNGNETFVSFGDNAGAGTRFDVKQYNSSNTLRVEVEGAGANSNPPIQDGQWHFIAVIVPNNATLADVQWYIDGSATNWNTSTSTQDIATGTGPLAFNDSINATTEQRGANGYLDDFQLYDEVLTQDDLAYLYANPGSVVPEPATLVLLFVGSLGLIRRK